MIRDYLQSLCTLLSPRVLYVGLALRYRYQNKEGRKRKKSPVFVLIPVSQLPREAGTAHNSMYSFNGWNASINVQIKSKQDNPPTPHNQKNNNKRTKQLQQQQQLTILDVLRGYELVT